MKEDIRKPHRAHHVCFPNLKQILDLLTVKAVMTPRDEFSCCRPDQNVMDAIRLLQESKFSAAPLDDEEINRYVSLERLEKSACRSTRCSEVATKITTHDRIRENTTIESLIRILAGRRDPCPLFVSQENSTVGLVTCADLDKIAVKVYFFILISALESLLSNVIGGDYQRYKSFLHNPKNVEKRYKKCEGKLVGLDEHHYLMTGEILETVWESDIKTRIDVRSEEELNKLKDFRNKVAHGNYIVVRDEDVTRLREMDEKIRRYIKALEDDRQSEPPERIA